MALKVVLFDFNGVILDDEWIHEQLVYEVMLSENLRCTPAEFQQYGLGRSDRACFRDLFKLRGRLMTPEMLERLLAQKHRAYTERLQALSELPIFPGVAALVAAFQAQALKLGIVSGAQRSEIEYVLAQIGLSDAFEVIVAGDDIQTSKPDPTGYLQAIAQFQNLYPDCQLQPPDFAALEDTFAGIEAARQANITVIGVAHTYPYHMLQRLTNWTVDRLADLEVERLILGDRAAAASSEVAVPDAAVPDASDTSSKRSAETAPTPPRG